MKKLNEYTPQELQEIGKKTVEARIKEAGRSKERNAVLTSLYQAWKDGKITVPGIPKPK